MDGTGVAVVGGDGGEYGAALGLVLALLTGELLQTEVVGKLCGSAWCLDGERGHTGGGGRRGRGCGLRLQREIAPLKDFVEVLGGEDPIEGDPWLALVDVGGAGGEVDGLEERGEVGACVGEAREDELSAVGGEALDWGEGA